MPQPPFNSFSRIFFSNQHNHRHRALQSYRWMTSSRRVQDRSKDKRVHDLEIAAQKHKVVSKILYLFQVLKSEQENIIPLRNLEQHRRQINLPRPNKLSDFLHKSPKLFELYKDHRGTVWCGLTEKGEELLKKEDEIIEQNSDKAAEHVTRMLMMSVDKRLPVDKIAQLRRDFGLPHDFRKHWVHKYPELFRRVQPLKPVDNVEYLELVSWKPDWSITELEKTVLGKIDGDHVPGLLSLSFPLKFPSTYKKVYRYGGKIDHFQKREYLSPYADARGLEPGSLEFDKRAVAVMHELLSFTVEKRVVTDFLTYFRREFVMPQKLMRLLLKHFGIFYVSERGKRFSVFLKEAYDGSELIEKHPLVVWKEEVMSHVGYRGNKKGIKSFEDISDVENNLFLGSDSEDKDNLQLEQGRNETMGSLENILPTSEGSEMEVEEVQGAYDS
ncbi:protein WHAT'S THIS FACTOR 1 homolog, chloroplastic [Andrographis paniculata]|uniref:protein WHAT'S THIS FACTOR 1 homolog, chloroplastic n=1 Tax=Andrographis paniculata TaxID=175694 RepID=UPI0021E78F5B|nr:protein WHAT'S THIS FACTOR 1 homolog, chloroplastic [Andrographis paniculata]XP_051149268.1 protein WHAT'S THIS FACTOR 1 homolog, chloroplastic [Andrographis paniculata]XP_051149275.1 protein WHAT'S THIS FACTOR 1 homolog, chloroplastic [Andrographis paniculata]